MKVCYSASFQRNNYFFLNKESLNPKVPHEDGRYVNMYRRTPRPLQPGCNKLNLEPLYLPDDRRPLLLKAVQPANAEPSVPNTTDASTKTSEVKDPSSASTRGQQPDDVSKVAPDTKRRKISLAEYRSRRASNTDNKTDDVESRDVTDRKEQSAEQSCDSVKDAPAPPSDVTMGACAVEGHCDVRRAARIVRRRNISEDFMQQMQANNVQSENEDKRGADQKEESAKRARDSDKPQTDTPVVKRRKISLEEYRRRRQQKAD